VQQRRAASDCRIRRWPQSTEDCTTMRSTKPPLLAQLMLMFITAAADS
jgi:hypothetical protein